MNQSKLKEFDGEVQAFLSGVEALYQSGEKGKASQLVELFVIEAVKTLPRYLELKPSEMMLINSWMLRIERILGKTHGTNPFK